VASECFGACKLVGVGVAETGRRSQPWPVCPPTGRYHRGTLWVKLEVYEDVLTGGGAGCRTRTEEQGTSGVGMHPSVAINLDSNTGSAYVRHGLNPA
jgi:hypothetical protein